MAVDENIIYEQMAEDFRALNIIFWTVPTLAITVNGGIFVAISSLNITEKMDTILFYFLCACNIGFIFMVHRLRISVMEGILEKMRSLSGEEHKKSHFTIAWIFIVFFFFAALFSGIAGYSGKYAVVDKTNDEKKHFCLVCVVD